MSDIDKATGAQEWLMEYYGEWIPLDKCLELVRAIDSYNESVEQEIEHGHIVEQTIGTVEPGSTVVGMKIDRIG